MTQRVPGQQQAAPATRRIAPVQDIASAGQQMPQANRAIAAASNDHRVVMLLALTLFLAPALGVPGEEMLQDTLKSMVVSLGVLVAAVVFFWSRRNGIAPGGAGDTTTPQWHPVMWLPLGLMAYALGSMAWSHTYLAGVEAIRWFIFSLLLWLGLNTFTRDRLPLLASAIHWGAVAASLWTVLQFLVDFSLFPQGPNPASTFVNRNMFAEYVVCTVPFSVWLLARARGPDQIAVRALFVAFNGVALMMTGTRSALLALAVLALLLPVIVVRYRAQLALSAWTGKEQVLALGILLATVIGLGSVPTGNPKIMAETHGRTAIERTAFRVASFSGQDEFTTGSGSIRLVMWQATGRMIADRPLAGVGAGAWEVDIPLYQSAGSQLETDFYAHNEFLQLIAEYGLAGWLFLIGLLVYLGASAWTTWRAGSAPEVPDALPRALALASLLALLLVSGAGFAWRMASTGAIFAVGLGILAATDLTAAHAQASRMAYTSRMPWGAGVARASVVATLLCLLLGAYISQQAAACERKIITAVKMALTISASGEPTHPQWNDAKADLLQRVRDGVAINPHYRKITPLVADNLATWGDWQNAIWIWESVLSSRPYVVAILSNVARGKSALGDRDGALRYLARAQTIQPAAPTVRSLEVFLLIQSGQLAQADSLVRHYLGTGSYDNDLLKLAYNLGERKADWPLAIWALELRNQLLPAQAAAGALRIGNIYLLKLDDEAQALKAYRAAIAAVPPAYRDSVRSQVPESVRARL